MKYHRNSASRVTKVDFGRFTASKPAESWARYYEDLAMPKPDDTFDEDHRKYLRLNYLLQSATASKVPLEPVTRDTVEKHIRHLKNNKACDVFGISAEHLKFASVTILDIITNITNQTLATGRLPDSFKLGILNPVPKPKKPPKIPSNFRRITITALVGKIVELHLMTLSRPTLDSQQSMLQFGFTRGCSPIFAALTLTEIIADAKDNKEPLIITLMDTSKAFDVVSHNSMLNSLYTQGVQGTLWRAYESMYTDIKSVVKWQGELSGEFHEGQGIRQGGNSSTDKYKAGKNPLLSRLNFQPTNKIGHLSAGAIMVADDLAITAKCPYEMQVGLSIAEHDASREQYKFNTEKTKYIALNTKQDIQLVLNGKPLGRSPCEPHLGILRNSRGDNKDTVQKRLVDAKTQIFSLLSSGFRGLNGTGPEVARLEYNTYVIPTLLYGLEAVVLDKCELSDLTEFHKKTLRCIQHLPLCTAIPAVYLLMGIAPVEGMQDIRTLSLFHNIIAGDETCPPVQYIKALICHQLAVKDLGSSSWTSHVRKLLTKYHLPQASVLLQSPPSKEAWKQMVKSAVHNWWSKSLCEEAESKSTLRYLNLSECRTDKLHTVWRDLHSPLAIEQASVQALLLVQRYPLTTSPVAGTRRCDLCPLCQEEPETLQHFLLYCSVLQKHRTGYLTRILDTFRQNSLSVDIENLIKVILDNSHLPKYSHAFKDMCRSFTFKLHSARSLLLGGDTGYCRVFKR